MQSSRRTTNDSRQMMIPPGTIRMDQPRQMRFPFVWLRQVIFGLLALILLPIGLLFFLAGNAIQTDPTPMQEATATIAQETDQMYQIEYDTETQGSYQLQIRQWNNLDGFVNARNNGFVSLAIHPCDVIAPLRLLPLSEGDSFSIWYDSENAGSGASCIPQSADAGMALQIIGTGMLLIAAWTLFTAIMRAAGYRAMKRKHDDLQRELRATHLNSQ